LTPLPRVAEQSLTPDLAQRLDPVCDAFEAAWRAARSSGFCPRIEDFLTEMPKPARALLLRELILADVHYRQQLGERLQPDDYRARFPELDPAWLAGAILPPIETRAKPLDATAYGPWPVPTTSVARCGRAPAGGFDDELRRLLRSRLILVHLLALTLFVLVAAMSLYALTFEEDLILRLHTWLLPVPLVECLIVGIVLWRSPGMSLRSLRLWELAHFGIVAAYFGLFRFERLVYVDGGRPNPLSLPFWGLVSLQGFIPLILAYGVLIPNTRRRSLLVVGSLTAVPFISLAAASAANPVLREIDFTPVFMQSALILLFPSAIAVFAAARTAALQLRAFEAERQAAKIGQYALKRRLGEGGMGEVWLAEHGLLKRPCAVKFIRPDLAAHRTTAARFAREVHAVTGLTHVNTVRVYDYGRADDGSFYYVMEYLDGPTLEQLVRETGPLPPGRVVYLLRQVCGALVEAHAAGLVHRDLKPGNVIVAALGGQRDVAKLLDFGLVQDLSADAADRLTRTGTVLGTPAYMSPEQAAGESAVDARGDVYGLGAVAFFALTGRPPFQGKTLGQLLAAHLSEPSPALTDLRPEVPADLAAVVARCLVKGKSDRFPSVSDLARALGQCECAADWSAERAAEWWCEFLRRREEAKVEAEVRKRAAASGEARLTGQVIS
jgi:serine/threonine-protein kinase